VRGATDARVVSDLPWAGCTSDCSPNWDTDTLLTLTAVPGDGSRFVRWSGGCVGRDRVCELTVAPGTSVTAEFGPPQKTLGLRVVGRGQIVTGASLTGCTKRCSLAVDPGAPTTLTARPAPSSTFAGWSGACHGQRPRCTVAISADATATAMFVSRRH
jgi:hypothetical protein